MSAMDTGGPAFPAEHGRYQNNREDGMTLRDYFAAKVMQGALTNKLFANEFDFMQKANWAYDQADAMLLARKK